MNVVIWLFVGGIAGWLASRVSRTRARRGSVLDIAIGITGALLGGWVMAPLLRVENIDPQHFSLPGLIVSLVGAVVLLLLFHLVRVDGAR